jgi:hypothetical protein
MRPASLSVIPLGVAFGFMLLSACGGGSGSSGSVTEDSLTASSTTSATGAPVSPLEGDWASGSIAAADMRAVVLDAGFTRRDADEVLGETHIFEFTLRFEGGRYALLSSWDGKDVGDLEGGTYRLIEDARLRLGTGASGDSYTFAIDLQAE